MLAMLAVVALSAVASSAAFGATDEVLFVSPKTSESYKGESGSGTLSTLAGTKIVCTSDTSEGELKAKEGTLHIDFKGCNSGGITCTGLGEAAGVILTLATTLLVADVLSPLAGAILVTLSPVHFSCSIILFEVTGKVLCLITPINTATKHFEIFCQLTGNDPKETQYWELNASNVWEEHNLTAATGLLTSENHGAGKDSAELTSALILTTNNVTIDI
jgi:hypothetical protein